MPRLFSVIEYSSHYAVRHNPSGEQHTMSDGVDCVFGKNGKALRPGTESFRKKWEDSLNDNESETMEAYFPDVVVYCDASCCEAEAVETVMVSVKKPHDDTRNYCSACHDVYMVGVQHGRHHEAARYGKKPGRDSSQDKPKRK